MDATQTVAAMLNGCYHEGRRLRVAEMGDDASRPLIRGEHPATPYSSEHGVDPWIGAALDIAEAKAPSDVTTKGHVTNWTRPQGEANQWSLFNRTGDTADTSADHDRTAEGKTFAVPAFEAIREAFPTIYNLRLNRLGPASSLSVHEEEIVVKDHEGRWRLRARFHLPVVTNDEATVELDGQRFHLAAGAVHYLNNGCHHRAVNDGEVERLHLVWDCLLDRALAERIGAAKALRSLGSCSTAGSRSEGKRGRDQIGEIVLP